MSGGLYFISGGLYLYHVVYTYVRWCIVMSGSLGKAHQRRS